MSNARLKSREVNKRYPTKTQLKKIVMAQERRCEMSLEEKRQRRLQLRANNGHKVITAVADSVACPKCGAPTKTDKFITVCGAPSPWCLDCNKRLVLILTWNDREEVK